MTVSVVLSLVAVVAGVGAIRSAAVARRVRARLDHDAPATTTAVTPDSDAPASEIPVTVGGEQQVLAAAAAVVAARGHDEPVAAFAGTRASDTAAVPPGYAVQGGARSRASARWRVMAAAVGGVTLVVASLGPAAVVVAVALAPVAALVLRQRRRSERQRRRRSQLPEALDRLAAALRAGSSLPTALREAGAATPPPLGHELTAVARATAAGQPLTDAVDAWRARHDDVGTRLAATALTLATVVGGAPARAVDGVAATLHERIALADERRALATQARVSALVLSVAPVAFAALLVMIDAAAARFLLASPLGWTALVVGLALDAAGAWWMTVLTRGDET